MTDSQPSRTFGSQLIEQDQALHSPPYQEHRMQLELKLQQAHRQEKLALRVVVVSLVLALALTFVCGSRVFGSADPGDLGKGATWFSVSLGALHIISSIVFWVGLASYYSRFRPAVQQVSDHLRDEALRETRDELRKLQEQIETLKKGNKA